MSRSKPKEDPISPGHAAYFSPYSINDPMANRVTGMVHIVETLDEGIFLIRNVDNRYECVAFVDELEEP
jgi:hypothetical protein